MNKDLSLQKDLNKLKACELFLLDMDGTLYLGDEVFEGAIDFIQALKKLGKKYIYLTNNSSRSGSDYIERLKGMGFPCEAENIYTSGMATAEYLRLRCSDRYIYVVGTKTFYNELKNAGLKVFDSYDYDDLEFYENNAYGLNGIKDTEEFREYLNQSDNIPVVCVGFDTELVYRNLDLAVHFLRKDAAFVAANPDWVCPMPKGEVLPDCGSICALLTASSGKEPRYIGKPNRKMVDIISSMSEIPNGKICCVGDRLYTDIAVAQNAGAVSVCVLSGECNESEISEMKIKPDYVLDNVKELGELLHG
ncbi:HAD-IIA family hydrolase [Butyrivibrio sp. AC2005]|uniref:HAD-IIA family hydrolase n=1 Tax=Butyrivibrio sp. AC2005 TaxID=1280672 RepID=UPI00040D9F41|nr:HAD-IIA family hydrolase [Butyrivibrio sp. AC2005]